MTVKTSRAPHRVTLPRALSKLGIASRSQAHQDIVDGKVKVNGNREKNPHRWVSLQEDKIEVDGKKSKPIADRYLVFHKPKGVTTTRIDERGGNTIYDILGEDSDSLIPVGRLDKETTGLLVLTNDHRLADYLTSPVSGVQKTYIATVNFPISRNHLSRLTEGVEILNDGKPWKAKATKVRLVNATEIEITIAEGKNRQIRKMFEAVGYVVLELKRISLGPLNMGNLKEGRKRDLSKDEIDVLKNMMQNRRPVRGYRGKAHSSRHRHRYNA